MIKSWIFLFITISSVIQVSHEWISSSSSSNSGDTEETSAGSSGGGGSNEYPNLGDTNNWDGGPLGPYQSPSHRRGGAWGGNGFSNEITDDEINPPIHHKNLDQYLGENGIDDRYRGQNGGNGINENVESKALTKKQKKEQEKKEREKKKQEDKDRRKKEKEKKKQEKKQKEKEKKEKKKKLKQEKKEKKKHKKHKKHK